MEPVKAIDANMYKRLSSFMFVDRRAADKCTSQNNAKIKRMKKGY